MKVKVHSIVFLQSEDDVNKMWKDLRGEDNVDMDMIIDYLMNWHQGYVSEYDSEIYDAEFLNTESVGYAVFEDDTGHWNYLNPAKLLDYQTGYLFSANDSLNYYGLSYYQLIPDDKNYKFKSNPADKSKPVQIYRNLNKDMWSARQSSKVVEHYDTIILKDCTFHVQKAGLERARKEKQRNVHAYVKGMIVSENEKLPKIKGYRISYNPFKKDFFYYVDDMRKIDKADYLYFNEEGFVFELLDGKFKKNPIDKQKYAISDWTYNWLFNEMEFDSFDDAWEFIDENIGYDTADELIEDVFVIPVKDLKEIHKKTRLP